MKIFAALGHLTPSERESDIFLIFKFFKCSFRAVRGSNYLYTVHCTGRFGGIFAS